MESMNAADPEVKVGSGEVPVKESGNNVPDNYKEKIEPAVGGRYMKLPDWEGFWFVISNRVYVYTKDGQFLDSPYFDQYADIRGWQYVPLTQEQAIKFIKDIRMNIDAVSKIADQYLTQGRELSTFKTELQWAFMWLGYTLGDLGDSSPYKTSFDPKSPVIEPHADLETAVLKDYFHTMMIGFPDETARVKYLRGQVSIYVKALSWLYQAISFLGIPYELRQVLPFIDSGSMAVMHLSQANMMLGQQLNQIRLSTYKQILQDMNNNLRGTGWFSLTPSDVADQQPMQYYDPLTPAIEKVGEENVTIFDPWRTSAQVDHLLVGEEILLTIGDFILPADNSNSFIYDAAIVGHEKLIGLNDIIRAIKTGKIREGKIKEINVDIIFLLIYTDSVNGNFSVRLKFKAEGLKELVVAPESFTVAIKV